MSAALAMAVVTAQAWAGAPKGDEAKAPTRTKNVILVMSDGLRWQEVFTGVDSSMFTEENGVSDVEGVTRAYDRETPEARREALLPFITNVVAKQGRLIGDEGNESKVTNGMNFSYPGYNEVFTGFGDPRIDSNDPNPNPNVTVFEWLNNKDAYRDKVAAFGSWDCFPAILNRDRSKMKVVAGAPDSKTFSEAHEHLKQTKPRVLFVGFGETDGFAHGGKYADYLNAAHKFDQYVKTLWETAQSLPEYRDQTTLIITTDHGRGDAPVEWRHHGAKIKGAERIWIGVLGPDTPPAGDKPLPKADQDQIAATIAVLLGEDYNAYQPKAGPAIPTVVAPAAAAE